MTELPETHSSIGTRLTPHESYVYNFIQELQRSCIAGSNAGSSSVIQTHNSIALYTLQMLNFATAHRAVSDPFFDLNCFDTINHTVLIEDKVVSPTHTTRLAWLPPLAISQLENYLSHLRSLSRFLKHKKLALADEIWAITETDFPHPIPLLFFLHEDEEKLECLRIRPSTLESMMGEKWELPLNTNRHLLASSHPET